MGNGEIGSGLQRGIPLSLYAHLPWCVRKCPYCDFNSHELRGDGPFDGYVDALLTDLDQDAGKSGGRTVESVFLGGGTPSLFPPAAVARLLDGIRARLPCAPDLEVTMEANPGTVERGRFSGYAGAGVNRVSLGAQSFDDRCLQALGRIHAARDTEAAVAELGEAGIRNFNIDLMFGLPGQELAGAVTDTETAIGLQPAHISFYQLTLEPNTVFYSKPPVLPGDDTIDAMQTECQRLLENAGFSQYEVSAFSLPGRECRHNLNYWRFGDYLGIGAGAHGKLTSAGGIVRTAKLRSPRRYMEHAGSHSRISETRELSRDDKVFEFALNALRLNSGFTLDEFEARTGLNAASIDKTVREAENRKLLKKAGGGRLVPTPLGRRFLNDLQALFLVQAG